MGVVEGNYLGTPAGGITLAQYELIKALPEIEVAAPVATVGFLLNSTGGIVIELQGASPGVLYRSEMTIASSDGTPTELHRSESYFGISPDSQPEGSSLFSFGVHDALQGPSGLIVVEVGQLPVLWTLVAGIDPCEESALVHLDRVTQGGYLPVAQTLSETIDMAFGGRRATRIPLIVSNTAFLNLSVFLKLQSLPFDDAATWKRLTDIIARGEPGQVFSNLAQEFASPIMKVEIEQTVDLDGVIRPMAAEAITFRPGKDAEATKSGFFTRSQTNVLLYPGAIHYREELSPSESGQLTLAAVEQGHWSTEIEPKIQSLMPSGWVMPRMDVPGDASIFRSLDAYEPQPFVFDVRGTYDIVRAASFQDPLSYVPLGIYEPPLATLRYDEDGRPILPRTLPPDLNPGGFIPRPPLALTTLQGAAYLRGREDFIDAIRVRVAGIEGYTPESVEKIEQVASEITERTGLHVDIVAGSSPQTVIVRVPGLGYVEERWTTLGATERITRGLNAANLILMACLLLTAVLFVSNTAQLSMLSRREELGVLKAVGWRDRDISRFMMRDSFGTGVVGAALAALAALTLTLALGLDPDWHVVATVSVAVPCLYLISSWRPTQSAAGRTPAELLRRGEWAISHRERSFPVSLSLLGLALRQVYRMRKRSFLLISITAAGVSLAIVLADIMGELQGVLSVTVLGEFVALRVRSYHHIMIITALSMGGLATLEGLLVSVTERAHDFALLAAVGWERRYVLLVVIVEGAFIGALGGIAGATVGTLLFWGLSGHVGPIAWMAFALGPIGATLLGGCAGIYPAWHAQHLAPAHVLSGSAERHAVPWSKKSSPKWARFVVAVAAILIGLALVGGRADVIRRSLGLGSPSMPVTRAALPGVSGENALKHAATLASLGPRCLGNLAEEQALEYASNTLLSYGWRVQLEPVPLTTASFFGADGSHVLDVPAPIGRPVEIAVRYDDMQVGEPIEGPALFINEDQPWPSRDSIQGRIVVLLTNEAGSGRSKVLEDLLMEYGMPPPYKAAIRIKTAHLDAFEPIVDQGGITISIPVSANLVAVLPGGLDTGDEIWLTAPYDSHILSPGADADGSGVGVVLEIARIFSQRGTPVTLRLLLTTGTHTGLEGAIAYIQAHEEDARHVRAVLEFEQVGNWMNLMIGHDLDATTGDGGPLDAATYEILSEEGQSFLKANWIQRMDLSNPYLEDWLAQVKARGGGMSESPPELVDLGLTTAASLEIAAEPGAYPCPGNYVAFMFDDLPAIVVCGEGNGLAGSQYDTIESLRPEQLAKAVAWGYQMILQLAKEAR
jgi:cell division protein FtsX